MYQDCLKQFNRACKPLLYKVLHEMHFYDIVHSAASIVTTTVHFLLVNSRRFMGMDVHHEWCFQIRRIRCGNKTRNSGMETGLTLSMLVKRLSRQHFEV